MSNFISLENLSQSFAILTTNVTKIKVPNSIQEALSVPEWRRAVLEEMSALEKNRTWKMEALPQGKPTVTTHPKSTALRPKFNAVGSLERYKARLVAKGFTQTYGVDYTQTFAPVAKLNIVRILISIATNLDWPLHQIDVKNAFLNGNLEEEVYMLPPPEFEKLFGSKVCKLEKALYGLKQSPRVWFDRELTRLKKSLSLKFEIKDLGEMKYFLAMEVARSKKGIVVSQHKYVQDLLKESGMSGCRPAETPMDPNKKLGNVTEVARSSTEAAYRAMANGVCEILWIRRILNELNLKNRLLMKLFCDNKAAISIAYNPVQHERTKHIEVDRHFIKENIEAGLVCIPFALSKDQTADILTKGLFKTTFDLLVDKLGMVRSMMAHGSCWKPAEYVQHHV
ncbi:transmembrane signal receptor [Lithospermum erythrorhizon]|uniref:Transmembrane signal receptor n=1 Tax=Lithospermum erythrorhizon TaxID=34254 RepID=A0AAV3RH43_LITER